MSKEISTSTSQPAVKVRFSSGAVVHEAYVEPVIELGVNIGDISDFVAYANRECKYPLDTAAVIIAACDKGESPVDVVRQILEEHEKASFADMGEVAHSLNTPEARQKIQEAHLNPPEIKELLGDSIDKYSDTKEKKQKFSKRVLELIHPGNHHPPAVAA